MNTEIAAQSFPAEHISQQSVSGASLVLNEAAMRQCHSLAVVMAAGAATVPKHLQKNVGDCMAVVMQASQWNMNPFAVAQKTHVVNGTLGYEAQLINAVITTMAPTKGRLQYDWFGDWKGVKGKDSKSAEHGVRVWATLKGEDLPRELVVTMAEAGVRNSPLWEQAPKIQLAYLAVKRWARLYTPDVILGVYTPDEFMPPRDMGNADVLTPEPPADLLEAADAAAVAGEAAYQKFWSETGRDNRKMLGAGHEERKATALAADKSRTVDNDAPADKGKEKAPVKLTFATVMDRMVKAKDADALNVAGDLIGEIPDPAQRAELVAKFDALSAEMQGTTS